MHFTTIQTVLINHIFLIAHEDDPKNVKQLIARQQLPIFTKDAVLEALGALEPLTMLELVRSFHWCYAEESREEQKVRDLYEEAGSPIVECLEELDVLKNRVKGHYIPTRLDFRRPSELIRISIDGWYTSIGGPEFQPGQDKRRAIRSQYLEYASAIIYALGKLIMPSDLQRWVDVFGELLRKGEYEQQLILDSSITHAHEQAKFAELEIFLPPEVYPKNYVSHGMMVHTPHFVVNKGRYGNRYIRNAKCKCAKCQRKDGDDKDYLNIVCLNPRYIKTSGLNEHRSFRPVSTDLTVERTHYVYSLSEWLDVLQVTEA